MKLRGFIERCVISLTQVVSEISDSESEKIYFCDGSHLENLYRMRLCRSLSGRVEVAGSRKWIAGLSQQPQCVSTHYQGLIFSR